MQLVSHAELGAIEEAECLVCARSELEDTDGHGWFLRDVPLGNVSFRSKSLAFPIRSNILIDRPGVSEPTSIPPRM